MAQVHTAIHLRTAEPDVAGIVDAWLCQHAVATVALADVYEACVYVLQQHADTPDLAFVGADWLGPNDIVILSYLRETWSSTAIVVYSSGQRSLVSEPGARHRVCSNPEALRGLLADPPERLLQDWRAGFAANGRHAKLVSTGGGLGSPAPQRAPTPQNMPPSVDENPGLRSVVPEVDPPRSILTHEELSALLDEGED